MSRPPAARRARARVALACLAVLAATQALAAVHHVAVAHVVCAVHGDLIHGGDAAAGHAAALAAEPPVDATDRWHGPGAGEGEHDDCALAIGLARVALDEPTAVAIAAPSTAVAPPAIAPRAPPRAILAFAPKTSPPA
jgi:hypothetical protein